MDPVAQFDTQLMALPKDQRCVLSRRYMAKEEVETIAEAVKAEARFDETRQVWQSPRVEELEREAFNTLAERGYPRL